MRLGYLYSRYPVISQTFCDAEMLALERLGHRARDWLDLSAAHQFAPRTYLPAARAHSLRAAAGNS